MLDPDRPSLYQRLGGHDVVSAFVEDLMPRLTGDPGRSQFTGKANAATACARIISLFWNSFAWLSAVRPLISAAT